MPRDNAALSRGLGRKDGGESPEPQGPPRRKLSPRSKELPAKPSGVTGVNWLPSRRAWAVRWREGASCKRKLFTVRLSQLRGGCGEPDDEALRDAIAYRKDLVSRGKIREARARPGS
mmetsp:Transcript_113281/g.353109  ORF Transcript_113281/g.353109 Transcript_113281/m.353109 type:complete len:117 (-) Transcript_113281:249-599(-)